MTWQHDAFTDQAAAFPAQAEVGDLKRYSVHYDRSGRLKGMAEVVFSLRRGAVAIVKRHNSIQLEGKPMKIEIVGINIATLAAGVSLLPAIHACMAV